MDLVKEAAPKGPSFNVDKLSYEIFSILEAKFLFGCDDQKLLLEESPKLAAGGKMKPKGNSDGKVRILSIDAGGPTDGLLAAISLAILEDCLRRSSGLRDARIADFFDLAAGSGSGGILAALLFTKDDDGRPLFSAAEALAFLAENRREISRPKLVRRLFRRPKITLERVLKKAFREHTLKDTIKPVLIPCYDLSTGGAFVFSRTDALETDSYDFKIKEVCLATAADPVSVGAVKMMSVDGQTRISAIDGGMATSNPTAAAITHVLNNKQESPFANGVEDLLVVSLGNGDSTSGVRDGGNMTPSSRELLRIAGDGVSDMVDQSVSMAFGESWSNNYIRVQGNGFSTKNSSVLNDSSSPISSKKMLEAADEMLKQQNVESALFRGRRIGDKTNKEKLSWFADALVKEEQRRKSSLFPTVLLKQTTPRSSSTSSCSCN